MGDMYQATCSDFRIMSSFAVCLLFKGESGLGAPQSCLPLYLKTFLICYDTYYILPTLCDA